jgi:Protein of unknown function (DUF3106)
MMRLYRARRGWTLVLLLVSGWVCFVVLPTALEARAEESVRETRIERWNRASREERRAMRESARDFWRDASPEDRRQVRHRLRSLHRALPEFSRFERRMILRRMLELPKAERDSLRERIMEIEELDTEARAELDADLHGLIDERLDDMHRIERNARRWQKMSPEERDALRRQARRFRRLPLDERQRLLDDWAPPDGQPDRASAEPESPESDSR